MWPIRFVLSNKTNGAAFEITNHILVHTLFPGPTQLFIWLFCYTTSMESWCDLGVTLPHTARVGGACTLVSFSGSCPLVWERLTVGVRSFSVLPFLLPPPSPPPPPPPSFHSRTPMKRWSYVRECVGKEQYHGSTNYKPQRPPVVTPATKSKPCSRERKENQVLQPLRESNNTKTAEAAKPKLSRRYATQAFLPTTNTLGSRHLAASLLQFDVVSFRSIPLKPH